MLITFTVFNKIVKLVIAEQIQLDPGSHAWGWLKTGFRQIKSLRPVEILMLFLKTHPVQLETPFKCFVTFCLLKLLHDFFSQTCIRCITLFSINFYEPPSKTQVCTFKNVQLPILLFIFARILRQLAPNGCKEPNKESECHLNFYRGIYMFSWRPSWKGFH